VTRCCPNASSSSAVYAFGQRPDSASQSCPHMPFRTSPLRQVAAGNAARIPGQGCTPAGWPGMWQTAHPAARGSPGIAAAAAPAARCPGPPAPAARATASWHASHAQLWSSRGQRSGGAQLASAAALVPRGAPAPAEAHERRAVRHEAGAAHRRQRPAVGGQQLAAHLRGAHSGPSERSASSARRRFTSAQAGDLVEWHPVCAEKASKLRVSFQPRCCCTSTSTSHTPKTRTTRDASSDCESAW